MDNTFFTPVEYTPIQNGYMFPSDAADKLAEAYKYERDRVDKQIQEYVKEATKFSSPSSALNKAYYDNMIGNEKAKEILDEASKDPRVMSTKGFQSKLNSYIYDPDRLMKAANARASAEEMYDRINRRTKLQDTGKWNELWHKSGDEAMYNYGSLDSVYNSEELLPYQTPAEIAKPYLNSLKASVLTPQEYQEITGKPLPQGMRAEGLSRSSIDKWFSDQENNALMNDPAAQKTIQGYMTQYNVDAQKATEMLRQQMITSVQPYANLGKDEAYEFEQVMELKRQKALTDRLKALGVKGNSNVALSGSVDIDPISKAERRANELEIAENRTVLMNAPISNLMKYKVDGTDKSTMDAFSDSLEELFAMPEFADNITDKAKFKAELTKYIKGQGTLADAERVFSKMVKDGIIKNIGLNFEDGQMSMSKYLTSLLVDSIEQSSTASDIIAKNVLDNAAAGGGTREELFGKYSSVGDMDFLANSINSDALYSRRYYFKGNDGSMAASANYDFGPGSANYVIPVDWRQGDAANEVRITNKSGAPVTKTSYAPFRMKTDETWTAERKAKFADAIISLATFIQDGFDSSVMYNPTNIVTTIGGRLENKGHAIVSDEFINNRVRAYIEKHGDPFEGVVDYKKDMVGHIVKILTGHVSGSKDLEAQSRMLGIMDEVGPKGEAKDESNNTVKKEKAQRQFFSLATYDIDKDDSEPLENNRDGLSISGKKLYKIYVDIPLDKITESGSYRRQYSRIAKGNTPSKIQHEYLVSEE